MEMVMFSVVSVAILAILVFLSTIIPGVQNFIKNNYELMLVFITGVYAFSTHKIVQASKDQIRELRNQNTQLQQQHIQNLNNQKLDRRALIFSQLCNGAYNDIDINTAGFLFISDIITKIIELRVHQNIRDFLIYDIKNLLGTLEKTNADLYEKLILFISKPEIFLADDDDIEQVMSVIDEIIKILSLTDLDANRLRYDVKEISVQSEFITREHINTVNQMRDEIKLSLVGAPS